MDLKANTIAALLELGSVPRDDWEAALQQIMRVDSSVLGVERVSYWSLRRSPPSIFCDLGYVAGPGSFERGAHVLERDCMSYFAALRRGKVIAADDAPTDPRTCELAVYLASRDITSMMDMPVWVKGGLAGVLCHEHVGPRRHWTEAEQDFAAAVAQIVASTLEARERTRAEAAEQRATFLSEASWALSGTLGLDEVASRAVRLAQPTLGKAATFDLLLRNGDLKRLAAAHVDVQAKLLLDELASAFPPEHSGPHLQSAVMRTSQAVLLPSVADDNLQRFAVNHRHAEVLGQLSQGSVMAVPLLSGAQDILGVMSFASPTRCFGQEDLRLAERFAMRVASALINARHFRQAQEAIAMRDAFMNMAARELWAPASALKLSTQALGRGRDAGPEAVHQIGTTIARQTDRLVGLVGRMLDAAQITSGEFMVHRRQLDLAELAREVADDFGGMLEDTGSALELRIKAPVVGEWDPARMEELVSNLLDNAIKFGKGKPIELSMERHGSVAMITVADHGIGIQPGRLSEIFELYQRAASAQSLGGLSLGLYIVRGIVEAHGGSVRVESRYGEGSRFVVELPGAQREGPPGAQERP